QRFIVHGQRHVYTVQRLVVHGQRPVVPVQRFVVPVQRDVYTVQRPVVPGRISGSWRGRGEEEGQKLRGRGGHAPGGPSRHTSGVRGGVGRGLRCRIGRGRGQLNGRRRRRRGRLRRGRVALGATAEDLQVELGELRRTRTVVLPDRLAQQRRHPLALDDHRLELLRGNLLVGPTGRLLLPGSHRPSRALA